MKAECPECGWNKEAPATAEGKQAKCPECGKVFKVGKTVEERTPNASRENRPGGERGRRDSPFRIPPDKALRVLAWVNLVICFIGGGIWWIYVIETAYHPAALAHGIVIWGGFLWTAFLLTIAQVVRMFREKEEKGAGERTG